MTDGNTCTCRGYTAIHKPHPHADRDGSEVRYPDAVRSLVNAAKAEAEAKAQRTIAGLRAELAIVHRAHSDAIYALGQIADAYGVPFPDADACFLVEELAGVARSRVAEHDKAEAALARVRSLIAHLHTDLAYVGDIHAALADPEEGK